MMQIKKLTLDQDNKENISSSKFDLAQMVHQTFIGSKIAYIKKTNIQIQILSKTYPDKMLILIQFLFQILIQIKNYVDQKDKTLDQDNKETISSSKFDLDQIVF